MPENDDDKGGCLLDYATVLEYLCSLPIRDIIGIFDVVVCECHMSSDWGSYISLEEQADDVWSVVGY